MLGMLRCVGMMVACAACAGRPGAAATTSASAATISARRRRGAGKHGIGALLSRQAGSSPWVMDAAAAIPTAIVDSELDGP
jgi:hypothetical protein